MIGQSARSVHFGPNFVFDEFRGPALATSFVATSRTLLEAPAEWDAGHAVQRSIPGTVPWQSYFLFVCNCYWSLICKPQRFALCMLSRKVGAGAFLVTVDLGPCKRGAYEGFVAK
ncbi:unnamed protein product [Ixodes pacificus]